MTEHAFSRQFFNSLDTVAIVEAIARADGWDTLDKCLAENAEIVETYMRFADAALRAIRQLRGEETRH